MDFIKSQKISMLGLSVQASAYHDIATSLTKYIKKKADIPIIWGGHHPTIDPENCADIADFIIVGEGEEAFVDLAFSLKNNKIDDDIPNLFNKNKPSLTRIRPLIKDLNSLPYKDYAHKNKVTIDNNRISFEDPMKNNRLYSTFTTRGCPMPGCSYCCNSFFRKKYFEDQNFYRIRSPENVISELKNALKIFPKLNYIRFDDEIFFHDQEWLDDFCYQYSKYIALPFDIHAHPNTVDENQLKILKKAGLLSVNMGIQNISKINKKYYNRHHSDKRVIKSAKIINKLGINANYHLILDDPFSSFEDKKRLISLLFQIPRPFELYLFSLTLFKGTVLGEKLVKNNFYPPDIFEKHKKKIFEQWRIDLFKARPRLDRYHIAMLFLISKSFIPKALLRYIFKKKYGRKKPSLLIGFAQVCNLIKMVYSGIQQIKEGKLDFYHLRQWINPFSLTSL